MRKFFRHDNTEVEYENIIEIPFEIPTLRCHLMSLQQGICRKPEVSFNTLSDSKTNVKTLCSCS